MLKLLWTFAKKVLLHFLEAVAAHMGNLLAERVLTPLPN